MQWRHSWLIKIPQIKPSLNSYYWPVSSTHVDLDGESKQHFKKILSHLGV